MRKPYVSPSPYDHLEVLADGCSIKDSGVAVTRVMIESGDSGSLIRQKLLRLCQRNQHIGFCATNCTFATTEETPTDVVDETDGATELGEVFGAPESQDASGVVFQAIQREQPKPFGHTAGSFGEYELVD